MPHQAPLQPGDPRRVGRYRLAGRITGIPADGPIFLASSPEGTEVTISVLRSDWAAGAAARDRFAAEAAVAKRVPPFCAARILDAGLDGGDAYLVSEYVHGRSLLEIISASGVLAEADLGPVAIGMATGLASVHQAGLVHGNFGPEYVIMTSAGPRVVEFGITPPYGAATPSADMLAWGQTVMFAAAGRPATTLGDLDVLPGYLRDLVLECLSPDSSARPSARTAVTALIGQDDAPAGVLAEGSQRAAPGSGFRPPASRPRRPPEVRGPVRAAAPGGPGTGPRPVSRHSRRPDAVAVPAPPGPRSQSDRPAHEHPRGRRGLRTGALTAAAVVVIAVIVVGVLRLLGGHGSPPAIAQKSTRRVSLQTPASTATASPLPTVTTPAAFAGAWSGEVQQPPNDTYHVALSLHHGKATGKVSYQTAGVAAFSCVLSITAASHQQLTLSEAGQGNCTAGTVTLTLAGGSVSYTFRGGGSVATGRLTRG
jgi:hypothetical protein